MNVIKFIFLSISLAVLSISSGFIHADTVLMQKQNTSFAIDGNNGTQNAGKQIYLWNTDAGNVNQQWIEIDRGNGYYTYQKTNTSLCIDGGNGGANAQPVILYSCQTNNQNQHWLKVSTGGNSYRLQKRNAPGYSIDGNNGSARRQGIYLWNSSSSNVNQRWEFSTIGGNSCDTPADVLDLSNWKVTIPYTSAYGNTDGPTNEAAEVTQPALDSYDRSPEFTNSGCNYVQFRAHAGGASTSGSGYPRSELREMTDDGSDEASWSSTSGTHTMEVVLRVTHLPEEKDHVVVAQIHGGGDDIITFRVEGDKIMQEIDGSDGDWSESYSLGETVTLKWIVSGGVTRSYYNGSLVDTLNQSYSGAYFKTGAYTQSACDGEKEVENESCSAYGEVEVFSVYVDH